MWFVFIKSTTPQKITMALNLTRTDIIEILNSDPAFKDFLYAFKNAQGYSRNAVTYLDDHDPSGIRSRTCSDFIVTLRLNEDGTLIENMYDRPAIWIFPGFTDGRWCSTNTQNPLYVRLTDNRIHYSRCAMGSILHHVEVGSSFHGTVRQNNAIFFVDMFDNDGPEAFEAHIHITLTELAAL